MKPLLYDNPQGLLSRHALLSEQRTEDPGFHVSDAAEVLHGVEGLLQVPPAHWLLSAPITGSVVPTSAEASSVIPHLEVHDTIVIVNDDEACEAVRFRDSVACRPGER